eukprot:GGOE01061126.1.p1 GENE.GGOE01061126.1~~GGOE01061126.1.p1  ORF type:complete len:266 (+),score=74.78 GGOE01061126.1:73-798(+)
MSDGEEDDHHFEYYFDNERGIDFKFVAGSKSNEKEEERRRLVQHGQARMKEEFRYLQPDDLFDPDADDDDDRWVWQQVFKGDLPTKGRKAVARSSDALLSCPCCFATVCLDCVRHDEGSNEWRAIDVLNCVTDSSKLFVYREPEEPRTRKEANRTQRGGRAKKAARDDGSDADGDDDEDEDDVPLKLHSSNPLHEIPLGSEAGMAPEDLYRTVHCEGCGVQVGVVDLNGIYHLFSVVPSNA